MRAPAMKRMRRRAAGLMEGGWGGTLPYEVWDAPDETGESRWERSVMSWMDPLGVGMSTVCREYSERAAGPPAAGVASIVAMDGSRRWRSERGGGGK
jgi:hypothetical protein